MGRKRALIAAVVLAGCGRIGFDPSEGNLVGIFGHRKAIVVSPPAGTSATDFVVSIAEPLDADLVAAARADGSDLVFASAAGQVLSFEIAGYDSSTGALDAWVRLPSLARSTTVFLYYGGEPAGTDPAATWSSDFVGVWHLTDPASLRDSTAGHHDLPIPMSARRPTVTDGIAGRGLRYDGVDDASSLIPAGPELNFGLASFSFGCWVFVPQSSGQFDMPIYHGGASAPMAGYDLELGTTNWSGHISDGSRTVGPQFGDEPTFLNTWVHLVAVVDRPAGSMQLYTNGLAVDSANISAIGSVDTTEPFNIGQPNFVFHGVLDEVRVYRAALTAGWVAAEYANLATRDAFVTIGPDERLP